MNDTVTAVHIETHCLYEVAGRKVIAVTPTHLADLNYPASKAFPVPSEGVTFVGMPGDEVWNKTMADTRETLACALSHTQTTLEQARENLVAAQRQYELLGEALLAQAEQRDWCAEYDEFAAEWDLPTRIKNWEVTMTVTVEARTDDDAREVVQNAIGLSEYDEGVRYGPTYEVSEA